VIDNHFLRNGRLIAAGGERVFVGSVACCGFGFAVVGVLHLLHVEKFVDHLERGYFLHHAFFLSLDGSLVLYGVFLVGF
jgi:hypothetical protein